MKDIIMPEAGELYLLPKRENNWHLNNVVNELRRVRQAWRDEHAKNNYRNKQCLPSSVDAGVPYRRQNELKTTEIFCENRRYRQSDPGR
jgi:hypothetical protein